MRLAIVADWLTTFGGAEHVVAEMLGLYPGVPVYTTVARPEAIGPLGDADLRCSSLQRWYRLLGSHQALLPWMPRAVERFDLAAYDVILSSSHAVAKGVIPPPAAAHVCYCHTPVRYAWEMEDQYLEDFRVPSRLRPFVRAELKRLRRWDLTTAKRVDRFLANSTTTQERIRRIYGRDSTVIPPPVDDRFFAVPLRAAPPAEPYFLAVGRLVPYKRFDLLIRASNALGFRLVIAGTGQEERRLRRVAGPTVRFTGRVSEEELLRLYAGAEALLFPQTEDAGIVLLEALACGTPCIAYGAGGALDAVDGETGVLFDRQDVDAVADALRRFRERRWDRERIRERTRAFSRERFRQRLRAAIEEVSAGRPGAC